MAALAHRYCRFMATLKTTAFVTDKKTALSEFYGVTKQGGYIGLGEITWLDKPSKLLILPTM